MGPLRGSLLQAGLGFLLFEAVHRADAWPGAVSLADDTCSGWDEMWGLCPDLPQCAQCQPVNCEFGEWGEWYDEGGCVGLRYRERVVATANNECGIPCQGPKIESEAHIAQDCVVPVIDCVLADWGSWSECTGPLGQIYRRREIAVPSSGGGAPCTGSAEETLPCGNGPQPKPCIFTDWQEWTSCSKTCGPGTHTRMRRILNEAEHSGSPCSGATLESSACQETECGGTDCLLSDWGAWSVCDSGAHTQRDRMRSVLKSATGTGQRCSTVLKETAGCEAATPEPCLMSDWSEWKAVGWATVDGPECDKECGGGQSMRTRIMQAPPSNGGECFDMSLKELKACNTQPCNAQCVMSDWSSWGECSVNCGKGTMQRRRNVTAPYAKFHEGCRGSLEEVLPCLGPEGECPHTDCKWGEWFDWSACSNTCGGGTMHRDRMVVVPPRLGGAPCEPLAKSETTPCGTQPCGEVCLDGIWTDWQEWGQCSASCGSGVSARHRTVAQEPNPCGKPVSGASSEYRTCEDIPDCDDDRDCTLSDWTEWSFCSSSCFGVHERTRFIKVFASGDGRPCEDALKQSEPCNPTDSMEPPAACRLPDPADCDMSTWTDWSVCSLSCGGGQQERKREILTYPQHGGTPCDGTLTLTGPCNLQPCTVERCLDCLWSDWSEWGECSKCGGEMHRHRQILQMPNHCGRGCDLQSAQEVTNCTGNCEADLFCAWTEWSEPSGCGAGCGHGTMMKNRALTMTKFAGSYLFTAPSAAKCNGAQLTKSECPNMEPCESDCVPRDCAFRDWSAWSAPGDSGLCERQRSIAIMNNECGQPCGGALTETKQCVVHEIDKDCVLSDWGAWGLCEMNGKVGQRHRNRNIIQEAEFDGAPCTGQTHETEGCGMLMPADCSFTLWADWGECQRSCGGGWRLRTRSVLTASSHGGLPCAGRTDEMQICNNMPCVNLEEDCQYQDWAQWSGCGNDGQRYRNRRIARYAVGEGHACGGGLDETESCGQVTPVDCEVSEWTDWDACDKTCGGGQRHRQRQLHKLPEHGGSACPGDLIQTEGCNKNQCTKQDCQVGDWMEWQSCSASCGTGQRERKRDVLHLRNPTGIGCSMQLSEIEACPSNPECYKTDCLWSDWSEWGTCSSSCDGGTQARTRDILTSPSGGGALCEAQEKGQIQPCNLQSCKPEVVCEDGEWADWSEWSSCSRSCEGGTTYRRREISKMANECGSQASGKDTETTFCNVDVSCEPQLDCVFTDWGGWSGCSLTCNGVMRRSRRIAQYGSGDGAYCVGPLKEVWPCNPAPGESPSAECAPDPPVDCQLADWGQWNSCSKSCDGGEHTRERHIITAPKNGGLPCSGDTHEVGECNRLKCPAPPPVHCSFGEWKDWSVCDKCSGERKRFRDIATYAQHGGRNCDLSSGEEIDACPRQCREKTYCTWSDWGEWGSCSAKCGEGKRSRQRKLMKTTAASAPLPPVIEVGQVAGQVEGLYAVPALHDRLQEAPQPLQSQEILVAFMCGFLTLFIGLAAFRAVAAMASSRSSQTRADGQDSRLVQTDVEDRLIDEDPTLGDA